MGQAAADQAPNIAALLKDQDSNVRRAAANALGAIGQAAADQAPNIAALLKDQDSNVRRAAEVALESIGPLKLNSLMIILGGKYLDNRLDYYYTFWAYYLSGGNKDAVMLINWLTTSNNKIDKQFQTHTMKVFLTAWNIQNLHQELREKLANCISDLARQGSWKESGSIKYLKESEVLLQARGYLDQADVVNAAINSIAKKTWTSYIGKFWAVHVAFWLVLISVYPKSTMIQAIFFWNPYLRKIMGLGYINFALTWVPYLRQKLFAPFHDSLLADAELDTFDDEAYFEKSKVKRSDSPESIPILKAITTIKRQIVLVGESGLGKSMFIRHLLKTSRRVGIYLPAEKCSDGVMEAIQAKLLGVAKDTKFLRNLIFSGAIDICIDGLNEVSAETRVNMTQFVETYFRGNVLMATQPMEWKTPATAKTYILQPLGDEQIEEYLIGRQKTFSQDIEVSIPNYKRACKEYITSSLNTDQPIEVRNAIQSVLSNPMDLDIVAQMLVTGMEPDLFSLHKQQYQIMSADYEQKHTGNKFPLTAFSDVVYQMRINDESAISASNYIDEIRCMERHKMVLSRQSVDAEGTPTKDWFFRHDKIMDFFIVQSFLDNDERPLEHMDDPRFRGVYFLLANLLPWDAAMTLREELIQYAADSKDVSVSHKFIQLIREREILKAA
ncbi:MAG: hypothetical protein BA863_04470 [Desulfovibrio sp. S3730MH75]|nr:MAG: hypothetical protein BA863_04470 [Desulfovibrio sp. S3730MH75]